MHEGHAELWPMYIEEVPTAQPMQLVDAVAPVAVR
jgi:hypothetical protein